jgi:hypothetical protein
VPITASWYLWAVRGPDPASASLVQCVRFLLLSCHDVTSAAWRATGLRVVMCGVSWARGGLVPLVTDVAGAVTVWRTARCDGP